MNLFLTHDNLIFKVKFVEEWAPPHCYVAAKYRKWIQTVVRGPRHSKNIPNTAGVAR